MIERFPEGTPEIPFPHTVEHSDRHGTSIRVRVEPGGMLSAPPAPKIPGFVCHFVGHHADHTVYSYKVDPTPSWVNDKWTVRRLSRVAYDMGEAIEDRGNIVTDEQRNVLWENMLDSIDSIWDRIGPVLDQIEDAVLAEPVE